MSRQETLFPPAVTYMSRPYKLLEPAANTRTSSCASISSGAWQKASWCIRMWITNTCLNIPKLYYTKVTKATTITISVFLTALNISVAMHLFLSLSFLTQPVKAAGRHPNRRAALWLRPAVHIEYRSCINKTDPTWNCVDAHELHQQGCGYLPETRRARRRCWSPSGSWRFLRRGSSPAHWTEDQGRLEMKSDRTAFFLCVQGFWFVGSNIIIKDVNVLRSHSHTNKFTKSTLLPLTLIYVQ